MYHDEAENVMPVSGEGLCSVVLVMVRLLHERVNNARFGRLGLSETVFNSVPVRNTQ